MNYIKDLRGQFKKSKKTFFFSIALIAIAIGYLLAVYLDNQLTTFNLVLVVIFITNGIFGIASGKGYIIGKNSYLKIDEQTITIKTVAKEKKAFWRNIETIVFRDSKLTILPENKKFQFINLKYLNDDCALEIKTEVRNAANQKGINVIDG